MKTLMKLMAPAALALALVATEANAGLLLSGTPGSGNVGQTVQTSFTIETAGALFNPSDVGSWLFNMSWDGSALAFDRAGSSITIGVGVDRKTRSLPDFLNFLENTLQEPSMPAGAYSFIWTDDELNPAGDAFESKPIDLGDEVIFAAAFKILGNPTPGSPYTIQLTGSEFTDSNFASETYDSAAGFEVRVNDSSPVPEPGALALLLVGLGGLAAARMRRQA